MLPPSQLSLNLNFITLIITEKNNSELELASNLQNMFQTNFLNVIRVIYNII